MKLLVESDLISSRDKNLLSELKNIVHGFFPNAEVLLYGSVARGTQHAESDYDILVLTDEDVCHADQKPVRGAVFDLELEAEIAVSLIFTTKLEWNSARMSVSPFRREVEREAVLL